LKWIRPALITGAAVAGTGIAAATVGTAVFGTLAVRALTSKPLPDNLVVLVTGGSRGLGLAIASRFARKPVRLALCARDRAELERAQASLLSMHPHLRPQDIFLVAADLTHAEECTRLIDEVFTRFGRIDVLVNNAGIIEVGPAELQTVEAFDRAMRLHFYAALHTIWSALPRLRTQQPLPGWPRRAALVNIASIGGKVAVPHMLPYTASKFALTGFSEGLHAELRGRGIRVTTVVPGLMRTGGEQHAQFIGNTDAEARWFKLLAATPGLATAANHAANRIYSAVTHGRAEITITPQAWIAAHFAGLCPEALHYIHAFANDHILH
jgi:NAD(P)-dependent dehydrogenase (short-subunit alcohol dehydrogenase family)